MSGERKTGGVERMRGGRKPTGRRAEEAFQEVEGKTTATE
jgi:hypothetical protein